MVFLSGFHSCFAGEEFKILLNLPDVGIILIVGKGRSGNGSVTLSSKNEAHMMSQNCKEKPTFLEIQISLLSKIQYYIHLKSIIMIS